MIDALKRHHQCEDVYRCLVFKEIRILYIKEPSPKGFVFTRRRRTRTTRRRRTTPSSQRATFATRDAAKKYCSYFVKVDSKPVNTARKFGHKNKTLIGSGNHRSYSAFRKYSHPSTFVTFCCVPACI